MLRESYCRCFQEEEGPKSQEFVELQEACMGCGVLWIVLSPDFCWNRMGQRYDARVTGASLGMVRGSETIGDELVPTSYHVRAV